MRARSAILIVALFSTACDPQRSTLPPEASAPAPSSTPAQASASAPSSAPAPSSPSTSTSAPRVLPPSKRSGRAAEALTSCKMADPPTACAADADCATFDLPVVKCSGCPTTLVLGVSASQKSSYLAANPCNRPACNNPPPLCVVHWHFAEDREQAAQGDIVARCVRGACISHAL